MCHECFNTKLGTTAIFENCYTEQFPKYPHAIFLNLQFCSSIRAFYWSQ